MSKKKSLNKSILAWLAEQEKNDAQLVMKWEGGGDSGWCYFEIDGEQESNEYTEALVDHMYDELNYGSWAGEFQANGEAIYNYKTKEFEGTDYYGEDDHAVLDTHIQFAVPKHLWFDTVHVECEANYDETPNMSVRLIIKNGFLTQEHSDICSKLEEDLSNIFEELFSKYESRNDYEFRGCNDSWILDRMGGEEQPDGMLLFTISKVDIQTITSEERMIVFSLDDEDRVNNIDDRLNSANDE